MPWYNHPLTIYWRVPLPDIKFFYWIPFLYPILYHDIITHQPYTEGYLYRIESFFLLDPLSISILYHDIMTHQPYTEGYLYRIESFFLLDPLSISILYHDIMTNQSYTDGYLKLWFHPDPRRCSKFLNLNGWIAFCYHDIIFNYIQGTAKGSQLSFVPPSTWWQVLLLYPLSIHHFIPWYNHPLAVYWRVPLPDRKFFYCIPFLYRILYLDIITH